MGFLELFGGEWAAVRVNDIPWEYALDLRSVVLTKYFFKKRINS